ncbi:hypothetical protein AX17_007436 [Amanita inopinata Kibby_2008]|nr:hypothetical protein AX17_007436 [Amanita inopinata Kibby_2008]
MEEHRVKRFKYQSYNDSLKEVHLPSALDQKQLDQDEIEESDSLFHSSLDHWRQLNLSPGFLNFANKAEQLCLSMPLLLHNWKEIINLWIEAMGLVDDEGLRALLDLLQKLAADLRTTLLPAYHTILDALFPLLPKPIPTQALSTLLETLVTFFKYMLIPSIQSNPTILEETWTGLCLTLTRCTPEVQRAVAEVWGGVLRRLKGNDVKEKAVALLAQNLEGLGNVCATALVHACRSVSQTLHTCTASLFNPLLSYHLTTSTSPDLTHTLIRRSLTAFIHHVKSADQFTVLADLLVKHLDITLKQYAEHEPSSAAQSPVSKREKIRRIVEVLAVACSVRQGTRLTRNLEQLFTYLPSLPLRFLGTDVVGHELFFAALLRFTTALYSASDMVLWLSPGRIFLQRSWDEAISCSLDKPSPHVQSENEMQPGISQGQPETADSQLPVSSGLTRFTLPLHASLAELSWGGWKLIALPLVLKHTLKLFGSLFGEAKDEDIHMSRCLIAFLAALKRAKKLSLSEIDIVWRERLEKWCLTRIKVLCMAGADGHQSTSTATVAWSEEEVAELNDILTFSSFFSSAFSKSVVGVMNWTLSVPSVANMTKAEPNAAWVVGSCLNVLASCDASGWSSDLDIDTLILTISKDWAWSTDALTGLVKVSHTSAGKNASIVFADIYSSLQESLVSHSHALRLAVLRLLISPNVKASNSVKDVLKRCLQGEEMSLDVQGAREKVVWIGRVAQIVVDEECAEICVRWLLAQLKINLRPVWSPAAAAIATLSQRHGELVWRMVFEELKNATVRDAAVQGDVLPTWADNRHSSENMAHSDVVNDPWEEERTWRDPSAHKLRSVVAKWTDSSQFLLGELHKSLSVPARFSAQSYEDQLLATLGQCTSLAEKHNRELVHFFLSLTSQSNSSSADNVGIEPPIILVPKLLHRPKLVAYLNLFSKFSNPKALYAAETLRALYTTLLSHPDYALQSASLSCLLTYKTPALLAHEGKFRALLDGTRWRDELTTIDVDALEGADRQEVVNVLIRLLFGKMLEKRGRTRSADRRAAVLAALAGCTDEELGLLVELMLKPLGADGISEAHNTPVDWDGAPKLAAIAMTDVSEKLQTGFLTLLGDVLKNLGTKLTRYWPVLLHTVIDIIVHAHNKVTALSSSVATSSGHELEDAHSQTGEDTGYQDIIHDEPSSPASAPKIYRSIRQLGLKRLADFFRCPVYFDFEPYLKASFASFISPRLAFLDKENTQAPSALLELFFSWTHDVRYADYLVKYDSQVLCKIYDCLVATNVKPAVVSRIFDIVDRLLVYSATDDDIRERVFKPHVSLLLTNLSTLVERTKNLASVSAPLVQRQINILSATAQYLSNEKQASTLIGLFIPLLRKPIKNVPEKVKVDLIKIIGDIMPLVPSLKDRRSTVYEKLYGSLSMLFQSLRSRPGRIALVSTFHRLASIDPLLDTLASLIESLNAYSTKRLDEPDFDRRLSGFADLNENLYKVLAVTDWPPVLYNALHFIQDHEELAIRNNSSLTMRKFVDLVAATASSEYEHIFLQVLFPGLKNGLRSKNELVRAEILGVLAYAVTKVEQLSVLRDMQVLLAGGDEEANFFNNILHVQVHRRSRALRRLREFCDDGHIRSSTLTEIFVPLIENFIIASGPVDHHLVNDAIITMGHMAKRLPWRPYYALVRKYVKLSKTKDEFERVYIRTLVAILDNFHFPMEDVLEADQDVVGAGDDEDDGEDNVVETQRPTITATTATGQIADVVNAQLLPILLDHLEKHDATTDDNARLPISIGIVNVAKHLPAATREPQVTRLLTILSQILRSRSQETRDLAREALQRIAVILGPAYLPKIIQELRGALLRGPQLHVLAFVTHSILVHVTSGDHAEAFQILDNCVNDIVYVSAEVIFGESGKDVQAEDFKTKMREVRASTAKGFDSFAIAARLVTPAKISSLLTPLRSIMHETESAKVMSLVDEVLKRVAGGLNSNQHLIPTELIVLCHTLISQNAKFLQQVPPRRKRKNGKDVIVQTKRDTAIERDHISNNSYRFVVFGLDLLHTALRRTRFDFHDSDLMTRLNSMIVVVGNTLYSTSTPVLVLGLRCAAGLAKCPLRALEKSLPVFVSQALDIIRQTGTTEAEVVQVAFRALASILRDGPPVQIKEKDLIYLLELLSPDLEEPSRQASVFSMLRAIVARKFVVPEIYDIMENVSQVMVTSQSTQVQELCRGVLLQFLLDYPQGKGRLRAQMTFLVKNLSYVHESGRKSVMELLNAVVSKFQVDLIQEYSDLLFVSLVMVIANDDSSKCREMAAQLIKSLFARLDDDRRGLLLSHLHLWVLQREQLSLARVSVQVYGFIIEVLRADIGPYVNIVLQDLQNALENALQQLERINEDEQVMQVDLEWQVPYHSLSVLFKLAQAAPDFDIIGGQLSWGVVSASLLFPHAWVRMASSRLLGLLFTAAPVVIPRQTLPEDHPLSRAGMREVAEKLCLQLKSENLDEALSLQVVKNLFYVGKCFCCLPIDVTEANEEKEDENVVGDVDEIQPGDHEIEDDRTRQNHPLPWLFTRLSYQMRSAYIVRRNKSRCSENWRLQPLAVLRWFAAMASHMETSRLENFLVQILSPIYRFTEDDTIRDPYMDEIKTLAIELQDLIRSKVGTVKFSNVYSRIRQRVLDVQRERKMTRTIEATANPEGAARRKMQRNVMKKMSKKRKDRAFV